ncbi:MAG: hypothetical protein WCA27_19425, partial [Candidatus Sulfotelmatobacter sp.]
MSILAAMQPTGSKRDGITRREVLSRIVTMAAIPAVSSLRCHASCFRMGSKFRCIRSTPTEMQSISENDFESFASTGVSTPM